MKVEVILVEYSTLAYRRVLPGNYAELQKEFEEKNHGNTLPDYDQIENPEQSRVFMQPATIKVYTRSHGVITVKIQPGWFTDLASVPMGLRSFVDNDEQWIIVAAIFHDACYQGQLLSFHLSNLLFKQICKCEGASSFQQFLVFLVVSSPFGRKYYERNDTVKKSVQSGKTKLEWGVA